MRIYLDVTLLMRHDGTLALLTGWLVDYNKHGEWVLDIDEASAPRGCGIWITEIHIAYKR